jgi:adenylate cyclase
MSASTETERRFLVRVAAWSAVASEAEREHIVQVYLTAEPARTVRVRLIGDAAILTVKGPSEGASRVEIECALDAEAARTIVQEGLHAGEPVEKTRSTLCLGELTWQVDQFEGGNSGLVIAEVEHDEGAHSRDAWDEAVEAERPDWLGREITGDPRFTNSSLAVRPFAKWPERERTEVMRALEQ